jgi:hypothetical protein
LNIRRRTLGLIGAVILMLAACSSDEWQQLNRNAPDHGAEAADFAVQTTLCRKVGSKSGRRIGVGDTFQVDRKSYVRAFVDFENVHADRPYTVHLVWIRPDGREMFRKYAEVRQAEIESGEFTTVITWRDAADLHADRADTVRSLAPEFTLASRFNISASKQREPGLYRFRVYLDRRLLHTESFTVAAKS